MKFKIIILIVVHLLCCCSTTKYGFSRSELEKNFEFVEYVLKNLDSLNSIFSDTLKIASFISKDKFGIELESKLLKEHIIENKFLDGYDYVDEDIYYMYSGTDAYYKEQEETKKVFTHKIKIKSRYNGEIIWFLFKNVAASVWKYKGFEECNNYLERVQELKYVIPCDKK